LTVCMIAALFVVWTKRLPPLKGEFKAA